MAVMLRADVVFVPRGPGYVLLGLVGLLLIVLVVGLAVAATVAIVRHLRKKDVKARRGGRPQPPDTRGGVS